MFATELQPRARREAFSWSAPPGRAALYEASIEQLRASFTYDAMLGESVRAPKVTLANHGARLISLVEVLQSDPAVVTFYRRGWCPNCKRQLRALRARPPNLLLFGARLLAISPQRLDGSLSAGWRNAIGFDVLSDIGNAVARSVAIVRTLSELLHDALCPSNKALSDIKSDEGWELPLPATYVVAGGRRIAMAFVGIGYRHRLTSEYLTNSLRGVRSK